MESIRARGPYGCFVDRAKEPDRTSIRRALGAARPAWEDLEAHLRGQQALRGAYHYMYGPRYGWALRFSRGDRLVLAMYPNRGRLTVQIILNRLQLAAAGQMKLPSHVVKALEAAKDYPEGKWLFIPVHSKKEAGGLKVLLALKMSPAKKEAGGRSHAV